MRITDIETIRVAEFPNLVWVRLQTDEGLTGIGETYFGPDATEAHIHAVVAPYLLGKDPRHINLHGDYMLGYLGRSGSSAEQRGRSATDIALWDVFAKSLGVPLYHVLGGKVRDTLPVYNTCANTNYNTKPAASHSTFDYGVGQGPAQFDDTDAFLNRPTELASSLLEMGIKGMKIWPFDFLGGDVVDGNISTEGLRKGLQPFLDIRKAYGDRIDLMVELHAFWNLPSARRIIEALREVEPSWVEDPVPLDQMASLSLLQAGTPLRIGTGETLGGLGAYKALIDSNGCGLVIYDVSWSGGITNARKVAAMSEAAHLSVAFHDCTGPVVLAASTHLALATRNCFTQEIARGYYYTWYKDLVTELPPVVDGAITVREAPGLGLDLLPDRLRRDDVAIRCSSL
ncbi:mandelate racemase/muconate lactonizing enzyme family protein (plasmid) [Microvirga sp. RSM25]|uniref:mandelate racemase/muconate lactonizing enzyme family protein n=1 Tax=Microvirga sp. RSM25 TaxID=3273802 RepID=UPI00384F3930